MLQRPIMPEVPAPWLGGDQKTWQAVLTAPAYPALRRRLDAFIEENRAAIDRILTAYRIPRVD